jgi:CRISPR/Cas system-associated exonuclease Cas4 (RecB family)
MEAPSDDVGLYDKKIQGTLMHATWKGVWERYLSHFEGEASSLHDLLLSSWDSEMSRLSVEYPFISDARFAAPIAKIRGMMLGVAEEQDKAEMRAFEAGFVRVGAEFERSLPEYRLTNLSFFGKADRIDLWQTPDSLAAVIVDYKLGNSGWYGDSLQLAAYAAIMRDAASKGDDIPRVVGYCYVGHADQKARGAWSPEIRQIYKATQRGRVDDLEERIAEAAKAMNEMDSALPNGIFTANYESNACVRCSYQAICRRSERFGARSSEEVESDDGTDDESDD